MDKIKNYTILGLFILVIFLLLLRQCTPKEQVIVNHTETLTTVRVDTFIKESPIVTKYITKFIPIKSDTIIDKDSSLSVINTYEDSLVNKDVIIKWTDIIKGTPISKDIKYKLLVPKYITKTITNNITQTNTIKVPYKFQLYTGLELGGNTNQFSNIKPYIGIGIKKVHVSYGYNLLNNTHNISGAYTLINR